MSPRKQITYSNRPTHAARVAHKTGEKMFRTYDTSHIRPKRSKAPAIIFCIVLVLILLAVLGFGVRPMLQSCAPTESDPAASVLAEGQQVELTIPEGSGAQAIAELLEANGVIADADAFLSQVMADGSDASLLPGSYLFTGPVTLSEVIAQLVSGPNVQAPSLTIPEGLTVAQTAERVAEAYEGAVTAEDFLAAANNAAAYEADYPFVAGAYNNSLEGFLFPKTYALLEEPTADAVVRQMLDQYQTEVASVDYSYAEGQGLSQYQVLVIASLIEREAALDEERPLVSSVIYNRLNTGMALQIDATIAYAAGTTEITQEDLDTDGPFNTYLNPGLVPGPICSPGLSSIQAAAQPAETSYLYYVVSGAGDGSHIFSEVYEDHLSAIENS